MAKVPDPVWSYGGVKALTSVDYGQTTQPEWSYGQSVLQNSTPTEVDALGVHWTYGLAKMLTSRNYDPIRAGAKVTGAVIPRWYYGLSTVYHKLVDMIISRTGRLRAAHTWVTATMKKRGRF
jgi:hypothetical protein